jgi:hypothetical protein
MQHTIIITEEVLHSKADYAEFRNLLPELLLKLIAASVKNPSELRIPFGGSTGQRGWDGVVVSPYVFDPYVPEGQSFWEMGVNEDPKSKADEDFKKRTDATEATERSASTFVFVTPRSALHTWNVVQQSEWLKERKTTTNWKDIRIIDGTKLSQWLYLFPGIEFWLAQQFGIPTIGLSTPLLHWQDLKNYGSPRPELKPDVFLLGRQEAVERLVSVFRGETMELLLETRYPEEGVDFVAAALASLKQADQEAFMGRCLIIENADTWKGMCTLQNSHIFVASPSLDVLSTGSPLRNQARNKGHGVVFAGIPPSGIHGNTARLIEGKPYDVEKALVSSGYPPEMARTISNRSGGQVVTLKRLLLDVSASPDWASSATASQLAIAVLIGQWDGKSAGDQQAVENIVGKPYREWIETVRPMTLRPDPPLIQRDEKWRFISRFEGWQNLGPRLSDNDLDRFMKQAVAVLTEKDPRFDLVSDQRWAAQMYGKKSKFSGTLMEGLAESLALLGTHHRSLTSCTMGKAESVAVLTVRAILEEADWVRWASLNDVIPLLAEAAPNEFLTCIEGKLNIGNATTFSDLFAQEGTGITGWNYMTGILWALETLAWSEDYLPRVAVVLGAIAEVDPGGNWANRPMNSLSTIFLPWLPQTCASLEKKKMALEALLTEYADVGWHLLLTLLPASNQVTSGTRKPIWRHYIPDEFSGVVTRKEYFEQVKMYAGLVVQRAASDSKKLAEVIERLDDLPDPSLTEILKQLSSKYVLDLPEGEKTNLWESLLDLVIKHRKYSDANWALPPDQVNKIAEVAKVLEPVSPQLAYRRLFGQHEFELYERQDDFDTQQREIENKRNQAVSVILQASGINGVVGFAESVTQPLEVGMSLGRVADESQDSYFLPEKLAAAERATKDLVTGFVWSRFFKKGWAWVNNIETRGWSAEQIAALLVLLPFSRESWEKARSLLGEKEALYWNEVDARPYGLKNEDFTDTVELLLRFGRPRAAVQCLNWMLHQKLIPSVDQVYRALMGNLASKEPKYSMDHHATTELIKWLQEYPSTDRNKLSEIEWLYLAMLDHHLGLAPKTLERRLAEDPVFFCEAISLAFRSEIEKISQEELTQERRNLATHVYRLLHNWRTPPGTQADGSFNQDAMAIWIKTVKESCQQSGHLRIALDQIGKVFAHAPADPSGLWIHKAIADLLNQKDSENMRSAFTVELHNLRGVFTWTAGEEEKKIALSYRAKAEDVDMEGYFRFAATLREFAASYERDAEREATKDPYDR